MRVKTPWTEEEIATLKELWQEGLTSTEIATRIPRTADAIGNKARSMKLARPAPPKPNVFVLPAPDQCTWLTGNRPNFVRCTAKVWNGTAWCKEHWNITHVTRVRFMDETA
jgi:hypothetical protein